MLEGRRGSMKVGIRLVVRQPVAVNRINLGAARVLRNNIRRVLPLQPPNIDNYLVCRRPHTPYIRT